MQRAIISLDNIIKVKQLNRGDKLYHYTTIRGVKDILDSREFWATKSDYLNDKSEFRYIDEIITRVSMDKFRAPDFARYFAGAVSRELKSLLETSLDQNELLHGYYVISFSLLKNNSLLWTEYSGDIGYSIEFDYQELLDGISIHNAELLQMARICYIRRSYAIRLRQRAAGFNFKTVFQRLYVVCLRRFGNIRKSATLDCKVFLDDVYTIRHVF